MVFLVEHEPVWKPALFQAGPMLYEVRAGYRCVYELENGLGECAMGVFNLSDPPTGGNHTCIVEGPLAPW